MGHLSKLRALHEKYPELKKLTIDAVDREVECIGRFLDTLINLQEEEDKELAAFVALSDKEFKNEIFLYYFLCKFCVDEKINVKL